MASDTTRTDDGFPSFTTIRPSPTNPHKRPVYINPGQIRRTETSSSSEMSQEQEHRRDPDQTTVLEPWRTQTSNIETGIQNDNQTDRKKSWTPYVNPDPGILNDPNITYPIKPWKPEDVEPVQVPKTRQLLCVKYVIGVLVIIAAIVAAVLFLNNFNNPNTYSKTANPETTTSQYCTRSKKDLGFNDVLVMNCILDEEPESLNISFNPEYGSYKSQGPWYFVINDTYLWQQGWNISRHGNLVNITKPPIKCNSGGHYTFVFVTVGKKTFSHTEFVTIENKLSDVSLEVEQNNDTSNGYYQISCSARSGCTPAPISLLGVFTGGKTEPIFGVNFTCIINYNDDSGWTVSCTGTVPEDVYSTLSSIACRPTTGDKKVDDEKEIKYTICRDCIFECPKDETTDSYWYDHQICNIFHRCSAGVLYTQPCPTTTYFNTETCACDFTSNLPGKCDSNNKRVELLTKRNSCEYVQN